MSINDFRYCILLKFVMQTLIMENYSSYLLKVLCNIVAIYHDFSNDSESFKIFDSHARDFHGRSHPHSTCVLLEVNSEDNNLVGYFKSIFPNDAVFELKGVHITLHQQHIDSYENDEVCAKENESRIAIAGLPTIEEREMPRSHVKSLSCAASLHSICFSLIKPCTYWKGRSLTPDSVFKHAHSFHTQSFQLVLLSRCFLFYVIKVLQKNYK